MTILNCILFGGAAGWLARVASGDPRRARSSAAVGIVGALLGLATLTSSDVNASSSYLVAAVGSGALLILWTIAQRLFVDAPGARPR
ncbi:MAG: hypothetical protein AAF961_18100 [Planctomycetota bacterium]